MTAQAIAGRGLEAGVAPVLAGLIPAKWQALLYWLPTCWTYRGYDLVLSAGGAAGTGGGAPFFLAASWRLLRRNLALRG